MVRPFRFIAVAIVAVTLALLLAGGPALAGEWLVDSRNGCKIWNGWPEPGESIQWDGPCENGYASGSGTLLWFKDGKPNGSYVGERWGGKANGQGINTWLSKDRFEGAWKDDLPHGNGTYTWANGSGYQGQWREGKKHGRATYIWPNGDRFEGVYENDKPVSGVYIKADGTRYVADTATDTIGAGARLLSVEERAALRRVGTKVCRAGSTMFGMMEARMVGFVEAVSDNRIQVRIANSGIFSFSYQDLSLVQNSIIWDDPDNWGPC